MSKYWEIARVSLAEYFVYRINFLIWRLRVILNLLLIYFLWNAVFQGSSEVFGYSETTMITYVLMVSLLSDFVFSSKNHEIGAEILTGDIINKLLKPISFLKLTISRDVADKLFNSIFALIEIGLLIMIFQPQITLPTDISLYIVFSFQIILSVALAFLLTLSIAMVAFWTPEIWAPRFIMLIVIFFLAGSYFPLDILPEKIYNLLLLTPFPYFIFLPASILLKGVPNNYLNLIGINIIWIVLFYLLFRWIWNIGMKEYSFYGR